MPNTPTAFDQGLKNYRQLRRAVQEALLLGQQRIEQAKVQTYWQTGKLIDGHLLANSTRKEHYGREVVEKLATDLKISVSVLWRCVQFARSFKKILATSRESFPQGLSWSHYVQLVTIHDENARISFMKRAQKGGWSTDELAKKIQLEIGREKAEDPQAASSAQIKTAKPFPKLIPKKGLLYTYRLIAPDSLHDGDDRLWIDLGFQVHRRVPQGSKGFKEGDIVESLRSDAGGYSIAASSRTKDDLFTYQAYVERVVDADTLIVKIDLGFENRVRQYLRLRGIDAPELSTPEGKKAKAFVEAELAKVPYVILTSSRSDKYDRYLADVFYGEGKDERYLNQVLLENGLAVRC